MKNLYPNKPIIEVLNIENTKVLLFTPLTEKESDGFANALRNFMQYPKLSPKRAELDMDLHKLHGITFSDIVAIGDTKIENRLANQYIESNLLIFDTVEKRNYKCFVHKDWKDPQDKVNLPYHQDGGSAWNCLMQKFKMPEYGIIYSVDIDKLSKLKANVSI